MYPIDKDVPHPRVYSPPKVGARPKYPFGNLKVGDSFFVPTKEPAVGMRCVWNSYRSWRERHPSLGNLSMRTVVVKGVSGIRIWRMGKNNGGK